MKIIERLQNFLACDQLATKGACTEADSLFKISESHREPRGAVVADFLVDVGVPKLLTEILQSLSKTPQRFLV